MSDANRLWWLWWVVCFGLFGVLYVIAKWAYGG